MRHHRGVLRRAAPTLLLAALVGGGVLTGCSDAPSAPVAAAPAEVRAPDTRTADIDYARAMIPHHEQALELSALARGRAGSPDVADLAFRIDRDQVEEVGQLQGALRSWGQDPGGTMAPMSGTGGMEGMASPTTLDRLRTTSGPAFDRLWLETMTAHHRGALGMARAHLAATGSASPLREFSRTVLVAQQAEIDRMAVLLAA